MFAVPLISREVINVAVDVLFLQQAFKHRRNLFNGAAGCRRSAVEIRHRLPHGADQLVIAEPDEVIEDDRHVPLGFFDIEGHGQLIANIAVAVADFGKEACLGEPRHRRINQVEIDGLADLQAAHAEYLFRRKPAHVRRFDFSELPTLRRRLLRAGKRYGD